MSGKSLATQFLFSFTKGLIDSIELPPEAKEEIEEYVPSQMAAPQTSLPKQDEKQIPIVSLAKPAVERRMHSSIPAKFSKMQISQKPISGINTFPKPQAGIPSSRPAPGHPDLGKLNFILADPRVESIECQGPNKNILVKKDGSIQKASLILTEQEIKKIIEDFSEKTRIPLIGGTFKAALQNLIMTAVASDFVGSRFMIQKKNPFQTP